MRLLFWPKTQIYAKPNSSKTLYTSSAHLIVPETARAVSRTWNLEPPAIFGLRLTSAGTHIVCAEGGGQVEPQHTHTDTRSLPLTGDHVSFSAPIR